ncbi:MAG: EpsG family protein [Bacillota bacterium]
MLIYIVLILMIGIIDFLFNVSNNNKYRRSYLIFFFGMTAIISALRAYAVGNDTDQFYRAYERIAQVDWTSFYLFRYELGFTVLCKVLSYISREPQLLLIVTSLFSSYSIGRFIYKNSCNVVLSSYLFITLNIYADYLNLMRQVIALSIILFGIEYLKEKKIIRFVLFVVIASLFHQSALFVLVVIFFVKIKYSKLSFPITLMTSIIGFLIFNRLFLFAVKILSKYASYEDSVYASSNYFGMIFNVSICLSILLLGLFICNKNRGYLQKQCVLEMKTLSYDFVAYMVSICLFCYILGTRMYILTRVVPYFSIYYLVWIPMTFESIGDKKLKILVLHLILVLTLAYYLIVAIFRPEWYGIIPYKFFWQI